MKKEHPLFVSSLGDPQGAGQPSILRRPATSAANRSGAGVAACSGLLAIALYAVTPAHALAGVSAQGDVSPYQGPAPVWDLGSTDLIIGNTVSGSLSITNGGVVKNGMAAIGKNPGGGGSVVVMGAGSQWLNSNGLYVGGVGFDSAVAGGNGSLIIADGGLVSSSVAYIGYRGTGTVSVRGTGSQLRTDNLHISVNEGSGRLDIVDGGVVKNLFAYVGTLTGAVGRVKVEGTGSLWEPGHLLMGDNYSTGVLTISNGGLVANWRSDIGTYGTGTVLLTGRDSQWVAGALTAGLDVGKGVVTIADGAQLSAISFRIADAPASTGTLNIGAPDSEAAAAPGILRSASATFGLGDGRVVFNHTDNDYKFQPAIHGVGTIDHVAGVTTLAGGGNFKGSVNVAGGVLLIDAVEFGQQDRSLPLVAHLNIRAGGVTGMSANTATVLTHVNNEGKFYAGNPQAGGAFAPGSFYAAGDFSNSGTVYLNDGGQVAGNVLRIVGNYTGHDGFMHFNTVLGDDNAVTDKLNIEGDTSGRTYVVVNNAGGSGAPTLTGLELIRVGGVSDGEFIQDGRIVAGAYDYRLTRGQGNNAGNWYLDNSLALVQPPPDPESPPEPGTSPELDPEPFPAPAPDGEQALLPAPGPTADASLNGNPERPRVAVERPESGSYTANFVAANTLFITSLHERPQETRYIDALTGEQKVSNIWLRHAVNRHRFNDSAGQLRTRDDRTLVQLGGNVAQGSSNGRDGWMMGAMAGYGTSHNQTTSQVTGYQSTGKVTGYGLGIYGTWLANASERTGAYVDAWAHYGWFENTVAGQSLAAEKYCSRGSTFSVETGYTLPLSERIFIQPKTQLIRMGVRPDTHREVNGTRVSGSGNGNLQARIGVQVFMHLHDDQHNSGDRTIRPFVETSWIRNTRTHGTTMNGVTLHQAGATNIAELRLGAGLHLRRDLHVWGRVGLQKGKSDYSDTSVTGGVRYTF